MTVAAFIAAQRAQYGVSYATSCRALGVSQAWFYKVSTIGDVAAVKEKIHTGSQAHDYEEDILPGSEVVGHVTFSAKGHTVDKKLAMAYVKSFHAWPGGRLVVAVRAAKGGDGHADPVLRPAGHAAQGLEGRRER